ncbi:hypothetical protein MNBD_GAMMA09-507 [hydrothermal vent metagenome]|uniref:Uncharacterized protein n=1 Tax=hydrothermal vent metagenome TaxID=652676 RepID=A0A3B0X6A0_9ZZZZ
MVNLSMKHNIKWQAPLPLWAENSGVGVRVVNGEIAPQPSILRFSTDTFMQDIMDVLNDQPERIVEWVAQPETWREPTVTPDPIIKKQKDEGIAYLFNRTKKLSDEYKNRIKIRPKKSSKQSLKIINNTDDLPLKLFQSTQQRFYMVSASLISRESGFPDRQLNLANKEKTTFVVRRLVPESDNINIQNIENYDDWSEYALVASPTGIKWKIIDKYNKGVTNTLLDNEEKLPMFPVNYKDTCGDSRSLHCGLIPVGKREAWMAAPADDSLLLDEAYGAENAFQPGVSKAKVSFQTDVTEPWKILVEQASYKQESLSRAENNSESRADASRARRVERDNIQTISWYILLDFAKFLEYRMPGLWEVLNNRKFVDSLSEYEVVFFNAIRDSTISNNLIDALVSIKDQYLEVNTINITARRNAARVERSLQNALVLIRSMEDDLESVENEFVRFGKDGVELRPFDIDDRWPDFLFPLADSEYTAPLPPQINIEGVDYSDLSGLDLSLAKIDALAELVARILPEPSQTEELMDTQSILNQRDAWFVVRCVYERPGCGPLFPVLLSNPTRAFQLASFFDPDAPARPVRIPMPVDISPAGLRKFKKNTAFVISDMLCGKIKKIRKITLGDLVLSVLPWPFHKDLPNPGDTGPCKTGGTNIGMICSLSIPIVTLCALILLMIMVALFDLFFRWIPFLFICLPIPGLKAKKT